MVKVRALAASLAGEAEDGEKTTATVVGGKKRTREEREFVSLPPSSPSDGPTTHQEKVFVPVEEFPEINFLGLLIGPRGSAQKAMSERTGARILIRGKGSQRDSSGSAAEDEEPMHVLVEGTAEAIAKAKVELEELFGNPEHAMRVKSRQLQDLRSGSAGASAGAGAGAAEDGGGHYGPPAGAAAAAPSEQLQEDMRVPDQFVGYVIGRGGETVQRIQAQTGVNLQVTKPNEMLPGETERRIVIHGSAEAIQRARTAIEHIVQERQRETSGGGGGGGGGGGSTAYRREVNMPHVTDYYVPNDRVGMVIGRGGSVIRALQERTGTTIQVPSECDPARPGMRCVTIGAYAPEALERAKDEITRIMEAPPGSGAAMPAGDNVIVMQIPDDMVGRVIGKGGSVIRDLQDRTRTRIQVPTQCNAEGLRPVEITGTQQTCEHARVEIENILGLQAGGGGGHYGGGGGGGHYGGGGGHYGGGGGGGGGHYGGGGGGGHYGGGGGGQYGAAGHYGGGGYGQAAQPQQQHQPQAAYGAQPAHAQAPAGGAGAQPYDPQQIRAYYDQYVSYYGESAAHQYFMYYYGGLPDASGNIIPSAGAPAAGAPAAAAAVAPGGPTGPVNGSGHR